jgi:phenylpropionate dioxygenase-like ring-hydroxylating dioxygenase large terminal subunit
MTIRETDLRPVGAPAPSVQEILDREVVDVPDVLREVSTADLGSKEIPVGEYVSPEFHQREIDAIWTKLWQMACRMEDLPEVGDTVLYDIADRTLLLVRTKPDEIKAYPNSCLHRGRQLRDVDGNVPELRCPYHGFCWNLDGSLKDLPCSWDFEHVDQANFNLPEYKVATWEGFVFINLDPNARPLEEQLGDVIRYMAVARPRLSDRFKAVHVVKHMRCNWKVALEAFLESFHVLATHPQSVTYFGDINSQYDVWPDQPNFNRMITPVGVSSPNLGDQVDEEEIMDALQRDQFFQDLFGADEAPPLPPGKTAREFLADTIRAGLQAMTGFDGSELTTCEVNDAIQYFVFPNIIPWAGMGAPAVLRFRPYKKDPDSSIMDIMFLYPIPEGVVNPRGVSPRVLDFEERFSTIAELGSIALGFDQDGDNLPKVQLGLHSAGRPGVTLGTYQESRIRHFHQTLHSYLDSPAKSPAGNGSTNGSD